MFDRILVPLDGSTDAEHVLPVAACIARASHGSLIFLRAVRVAVTLGRDVTRSLPLLQETMEAERSKAVRYLVALARLPLFAGIATTTKVVFGEATQAILDVARSHQVALIVMSISGKSAVKRWVGGSVAQQVVRQSVVPALLLPNETQFPFGSSPGMARPPGRFVVLVGLDGSRHAESALFPAAALAATLAASTQGSLHLLRVVRLPETGSRRTDRRVLCEASQYMSAFAVHARQALAMHPFADFHLTVTWSLALDINVAACLVRVAEQGQVIEGTRVINGCDLIAVTTHGRRGLERLVMGNMTARVLGATRLPVVVVRSSEVEVHEKSNAEEESESEVRMWSGQ
jgi:nucleotide-binding universal stress UspA family protein